VNLPAKHFFVRVVIEGAARNGPWKPIRGPRPQHGDRAGNALFQKAKWTRKQITTGTWRLSPKGRTLDEEARAWRARGW